MCFQVILWSSARLCAPHGLGPVTGLCGSPLCVLARSGSSVWIITEVNADPVLGGGGVDLDPLSVVPIMALAAGVGRSVARAALGFTLLVALLLFATRHWCWT